MDEFIYIIGLLITIVAYLMALTYWLDRRFESFECRFQVVEGVNREIETRLGNRMINLENRIIELEDGLKSAVVNSNIFVDRVHGSQGPFSHRMRLVRLLAW